MSEANNGSSQQADVEGNSNKLIKNEKKGTKTQALCEDGVGREGDADQLLEENNKLREQNLKLQKILASAGVKLDVDAVKNVLEVTSSQPLQAASFLSDIQDIKVSGGLLHASDDDYNTFNNNRVECSSDVQNKPSNIASRESDDNFGAGSTTEVVCDTSTNVEEEHQPEMDLFADLRVDTTVNIKAAQQKDKNLTLNLPVSKTDQSTKTTYSNLENIVDISPPLPTSSQFNFSTIFNPPSSLLSSHFNPFTLSLPGSNPIFNAPQMDGHLFNNAFINNFITSSMYQSISSTNQPITSITQPSLPLFTASSTTDSSADNTHLSLHHNPAYPNNALFFNSELLNDSSASIFNINTGVNNITNSISRSGSSSTNNRTTNSKTTTIANMSFINAFNNINTITTSLNKTTTATSISSQLLSTASIVTSLNTTTSTINTSTNNKNLTISSSKVNSNINLVNSLNNIGQLNNNILINNLGQPVSFVHPQPLFLNANTGVLTPHGKILSPATPNFVTPQTNIFMPPNSNSLNFIPQATPLFNSSQLKPQMTFNILPQNTSRDFLMLPNGKLVPISTQPSILPNNSSHPMQSIITGFPNQIRLQTPQYFNPRNPQSLNLLPPSFIQNPPLNGLPLLAPNQLPLQLQQVSPDNSQTSMLQSQGLLVPQPCMTAYITPEGTIVLSLNQQVAKKSDDASKNNQSSLILGQEKKAQRRIMPKPPTSDPLITSNLTNIVSKTSHSVDITDLSDKSQNNFTASFVSSMPSISLHDNFNKLPIELAPISSNIEYNFLHQNEDLLRKKTTLKKKEGTSNEKKKRVKQKQEVATSTATTTTTTEATSESFQSICLDSLNDSYPPIDDDQGDINQFSDLIVMESDPSFHATPFQPTFSDNKAPIFEVKGDKTSEESIFCTESLMSSLVQHLSGSFKNIDKKQKKKKKKTQNNQQAEKCLVVGEVRNDSNTPKIEISTPLKTNQDTKLPSEIISDKTTEKNVEDVVDGLKEDLVVGGLKGDVVVGGLKDVVVGGLKDVVVGGLKGDVVVGGLKSDVVVSGLKENEEVDGLKEVVVAGHDMIPLKVEEGTQTMKIKKNKKIKSSKQQDKEEEVSKVEKEECQNEVHSNLITSTDLFPSYPDKLPDKRYDENEVIDFNLCDYSVDQLNSVKISELIDSYELINRYPPFLLDFHNENCGEKRKCKEEERNVKKMKLSEGRCKNCVNKDDLNALVQKTKNSDDKQDKTETNYKINDKQDVKKCQKSKDNIFEKIGKSTYLQNDRPPDEQSKAARHTSITSLTLNKNSIYKNQLNFSKCSKFLSKSAVKTCDVKRDVELDMPKLELVTNNLYHGVEDKPPNIKMFHESPKHIPSLDMFGTSSDKPPHDLPSPTSDACKNADNKKKKQHESKRSNDKFEVKNRHKVDKEMVPDKNKAFSDSKRVPTDNLKNKNDKLTKEASKNRDTDKLPQNKPFESTIPPTQEKKCSDVNHTKDACKVNEAKIPNNNNNLSESYEHTMDQRKNDNEGTKGSREFNADGANYFSDKHQISKCAEDEEEEDGEEEDEDEDDDGNKDDGGYDEYYNAEGINSQVASREKGLSDYNNNMYEQETPIYNNPDAYNFKEKCPQNECIKDNLPKEAYNTQQQAKKAKLEQNDQKFSDRTTTPSNNSHKNKSYDEMTSANMADVTSTFNHVTFMESNVVCTPSTNSPSTFNNNNNNNNNNGGGNSNTNNGNNNSNVNSNFTISFNAFNNANNCNNSTCSNPYFYSVDDNSKKFTYPNIFAPSLFPDPYNSSCSQFSTFPAGSTFEPSFMLPHCLSFDSTPTPGFNYYNDSSRYSHFGYPSLKNSSDSSCNNNNTFFPGNSILSEFPSCSLETKKMSTFQTGSRSHQGSKEESCKNVRGDFSRKDSFGDFEHQFMLVGNNADKMHYFDGSNYDSNFDAKSYSFQKSDNIKNQKNNSSFYKNNSNPLNSPPLHHHPLLFDQKNANCFGTGFDLPFGASNFNSFMENCGIMDQSFMQPTTFSQFYGKDPMEEKKSNKSTSNKMYPPNIKQNMSSSSNTTPSNTITKSKSKSSKKSTTKNENACMFNHTSTALKIDTDPSYYPSLKNSPTNKFNSQYSSSSNRRASMNLGVEYVSTQILGSSGSHPAPPLGLNHFFPEMDLPNSYLKFGNSSELDTMPLHHSQQKSNQQGGGAMLTDLNPFFHPPSQYSLDTPAYFNQPNTSSPFSPFNIRMPRMYNHNSSF